MLTLLASLHLMCSMSLNPAHNVTKVHVARVRCAVSSTRCFQLQWIIVSAVIYQRVKKENDQLLWFCGSRAAVCQTQRYCIEE